MASARTQSNPYAIYKAKTSGTAKTSNATPAEDTAFTVTIAAGQTWLFQFDLVFDFDATAGIQWAMDADSGTISGESMRIVAVTDSSVSGTAFTFADRDITLDGTSVPELAASASIRFLFASGAAARTPKFKWAQAVSNGAATNLLAGSSLIAQRIS